VQAGRAEFLNSAAALAVLVFNKRRTPE